MTTTRRHLLAMGAATAAIGLVGRRALAQEAPAAGGGKPQPATGYRPVVTPNGATLAFRVVDGVKVFHLIAEEVEHEFAPGLRSHCWGYNGRVHGPTIEAVEGDRIRIYVTNRLPVSTTVHWHGLYVPSGMDGVGGLSQRPIEPGETFLYEFTLRQHGTFMYHSHHDEMVQMAMGLMGMFVVHERSPSRPQADRDYVLLLSEWALKPGTWRPDPNEMGDFNVLTMNARVFPGTAPLVAKLGERVRIRIGNLSAMDHHPIHLHGTSFRVVATDGGDVPPSAQWPETSVLVPTGATRTIEFTADNLGDWAIHCHMTHHVMTQMGHGIPNLIGTDASEFDIELAKHVPALARMGQLGLDEHDGDAAVIPPNSTPMAGGDGPFGYITMGGMFTVVKVRESLDGDADPGWYKAPAGTQADVASADALKRDGIDVP